LKSRKRTVRTVLAGHEETTHLAKGRGTVDERVSIIVLHDSTAPFAEGALAGVPHITLHEEDDLLLMIGELQEENARLRSLSLIDSLTGLGNKRFFWMQLETEMARTRRTDLPCTLMMIDLDNFKALNDTLGHLEGDGFLREFGRTMRDNSRSTDLPCRYGGDEFALIMPATSVADAVKTGERLKSIVGEMPQKSRPSVSLSIGISEYTSCSNYDMNGFIRAADMAMYAAKGDGKNRISIDPNWEESRLEDNEVNRDERDALFTDYD
jgi:diguanylate cyclase (GGDEF)-like protein